MAGERMLYLIRHAIAHERSKRWPDDDLRPLTDEGIAKMRRAAEGLRAFDVHFDGLISSPLVRARQTADIVAAAFKKAPKIVEAAELSPGRGPDAVAKMLAAHKGHDEIGLVGHEPDLGEMAAWLIGAEHPIPFKKGGVARIDVSAAVGKGSGRLVFLATPSILRHLA